jgi:hypothetical protein
MLKLSSPRREVVVEDWPSGRHRVTASFQVEAKDRKGERVVRTTTDSIGRVSKPKRTTYHLKIRLVDGDDGRVYVLGITEYGQVVLIPGTLKTAKYFYPEDEEYGAYRALLESAK